MKGWFVLFFVVSLGSLIKSDQIYTHEVCDVMQVYIRLYTDNQTQLCKWLEKLCLVFLRKGYTYFKLHHLSHHLPTYFSSILTNIFKFFLSYHDFRNKKVRRFQIVHILMAFMKAIAFRVLGNDYFHTMFR